MGIVAGLTAGAGAALIRDMSPRLSRALAFGLLTIGPVGANFLSNYVAGQTLPIYHTWQSQIWIMGFFAVAMYIPIVLWLCDLSPELRMQIMKTEIQALAAEGRLPSASELPSEHGRRFPAPARSHGSLAAGTGHHRESDIVLRHSSFRTVDVHGGVPLRTSRSRKDERILLAGKPRRAGLDRACVRSPADPQTDRNLRRRYSLAS